MKVCPAHFAFVRLAVAIVGVGPVAAWCADAPAAAHASFHGEIVPLLQKYCYQCHGDEEPEAGLAFVDYKGADDVLADQATWKTVQDFVRSYQMPPPEAEHKPSAAEREKLVGWIDETLFAVDPDNPDPGRVTIRRLNRAEYNNTVRDLIGVDFKPADNFPVDDSGYGFDNIGDVLSLPPVLMEKYLAAAEEILDRAIVTEPGRREVRRFNSNVLEVGFNALGDRGDGWIHLISLEDDDAAVQLDVPAPADYIVRVHAFAQPTGGMMYGGGNNSRVEPQGPVDPMQMMLALNDAKIASFEVTTDEANPGTYEVRVGLPAGAQRIRAVNSRIRGGANELIMVNGRLGKQQPGVLFVRWIEIEGPLPGVVRRFAAQDLAAAGEGEPFEKGARLLTGNGEVTMPITLTGESDVILRAQAFADQAGTETARMEFRIDGEPLETFDVVAPGYMQPLSNQRVFSKTLLVPRPEIYEKRVRLPAGTHRFAAAFVNDFADPAAQNPNLRDRNLVIQNLEVVNLARDWEAPPMPAQLQAVFARHDTGSASEIEAARGIIRDFATHAWRRPLSRAELERLMDLYALAEAHAVSFPARVKLALQGVLVSPHFIYRGEVQPDPDNPEAIHPVDEYALASRLSYFLWSSMPDDELFGLAQRGALRANLEAQVRRMLASPKAGALVQNFAGQWLQTRAMEGVYPDRDVFPDFDQWLREGMQEETERFFSHILREDRSILEFLTGEYTFVNERLAKHYGLNGVTGDEFRQVSLAGTTRRGVLTQGSVLSLTSNPTRTSPVKRGKWVLENLLGTPPPPPPPDIPELDDPERKLTGTLREQMQQHRANPSCASCHEQMDAIGFGLENFDGVGAWRDRDAGGPIDASGVLGSGDTFAGALELADVLATKRRGEFVRCIAEKMLTYALGRGTEPYDRVAIRGIAQRLEQADFRFSELVLGVVESVPFQKRRGDRASAASVAVAQHAD